MKYSPSQRNAWRRLPVQHYSIVDVNGRLQVAPEALRMVAHVGRPRRAESYHRSAMLAAMRSATFNAESAGSALHVLMSMMTLFLSVNARPQPQPGALAFP
jgi:hypothetical protein